MAGNSEKLWKQEIDTRNLDNKDSWKWWEIANLLNQIPTFNIAELENKCKWINLNNIRGELTDRIKSIDEDLSIENFFIETPKDVQFIINLGKNSSRWEFKFKNKKELVKYLEWRREKCSLPINLLENTEKIPLDSFIKIYEWALEETDNYYMIQDRFW